MSKKYAAFIVAALLAATSPGVAADNSLDSILHKAIQAYQVKPHQPSERRLGPKEKLGQALFFDPFVSGPKKIACATCHVRSKGAGDGLPMAVGLGAKGVSTERLAHAGAFIIPRNALPFFNRGSKEFRALFWDGRVQLGPTGLIETPLGSRQPSGFDSLLAAAVVFPPAEPDEMLGRSLRRGTKDTYHAELVTIDDEANNLQERTLNAFGNLVERLLEARSRNPKPVALQYRKLFAEAYPGTALNEFRIHHVGNALAAYIGAAFELKPAPWDWYVAGATSALTAEQKQGAFIFFGKGRCVVCHSGTQFSDFRFHGLAVPQMRVGKHNRYIDYGRASATSRGEDRFAFRTPPLRNVTETFPWGHNGIFSSLDAVIGHHVNPVPMLYKAQQEDSEEAANAGRLLGFRSPILAEMAPLSKAEIGLLVKFLKALTSETVMPDSEALPATVPSGDRSFVRK
jgi:cytochrome c peroxidase